MVFGLRRDDVDPGDQFVDPGFHIDPDNQDVDPGDQFVDLGSHVDPGDQVDDPVAGLDRSQPFAWL